VAFLFPKCTIGSKMAAGFSIHYPVACQTASAS